MGAQMLPHFAGSLAVMRGCLPHDQKARAMKMINQSYRSFSMLVEVNIDRFLVPLTIIGALTVAGWLVSL